jgi:hypothetical protein
VLFRSQTITSAAPQAEIIFGATIDKAMTGRAQAILVATGLEEPRPVVAPAPRVITAVAPPAAVESQTKCAPQNEPVPAGHLADALFTRALASAIVPDESTFASAEAPAPMLNPNLDLPAFLRRRRNLRDLEKG